MSGKRPKNQLQRKQAGLKASAVAEEARGMLSDQINIKVLYTLYQETIFSDIFLDFQVYSEPYNHVTILQDTRKGEKLYYYLERFLHPEVSINAKDLDAIMVSVWSNGFLYAGGIWQIHWSAESEHHYILEGICAAGLELVEVRTLLSQEEYQLIGQAIQLAFAYWEENSPDAIFTLDECEETEGNTLEMHRQALSSEQRDWREKKTWHIVINRFTDEGPNPIQCHTLVHYYPERPGDASLTVEEA